MNVPPLPLLAVALVLATSATAQPELRPLFKEGELLVKLKPGTSRVDEERLLATDGAAPLRSFRRPRVLGSSRVERWRLVRLPPGLAAEEAVERFAKRPGVEAAEPNYFTRAVAIPGDPSFASQWHLLNLGQTGGTTDADVDAVEGWNILRDSSTIVIAVIDTGIDYAHPDLASNIWTNPGEIPGNGVDDDANGYVDDLHGYDFLDDDPNPMDEGGPPGVFHGTHVAGIIGAAGHNGVGVSGVSWVARMMALRALEGPVDAAVEALVYAMDNGARITSNSWTSPFYSQFLFDAFADAEAAGLLSVAAAGNDINDLDSFDVPGYPFPWWSFPATFPFASILTVASTDPNDGLSWFSNWGSTSVDLGAPGSDILSTLRNGAYGLLSGTSMATPVVSGAAALVWAQEPLLTALELKARLLDTTDPIPALAGKTVTGGRLNLHQALQPGAPPPQDVSHLLPVLQSLLLLEETPPPPPPPRGCGLGFELLPALFALALLRAGRRQRREVSRGGARASSTWLGVLERRSTGCGQESMSNRARRTRMDNGKLPWVLCAILVGGTLAASMPRVASAADNTTSPFTIERVVSGVGSDKINVYPVGAVENPEGCSVADAYQSESSLAGHDERTVMIVSAHLSGRVIGLHIDGCTSVGRPKITSVGIE
jgi:hypothetical protein